MDRFFRRMLTAPLLLLLPALRIADGGNTVGDAIDYDALGRMVDSRLARAERGVIRDYFAQHGLDGDAAALAEERYRELRRAAHPDADALKALEKRCGSAEKRLREMGTETAARIHMARLGVDDEAADDMIVLARRRLEREGAEDPTAEDVRRAVQAVLEGLPRLIPEASRTAEMQDAGSTGNFPRNEGGQDILQRRLDSLRASGDAAAAVALINAAAEKGVTLR